MNFRKKRCANPVCRKVFSYAPGEKIRCPWCGDASRRVDGYQLIGRCGRCKGTFRFGMDRIPALIKGRYTVRLERLATPKKLYAIGAYRRALADKALSLKEGKLAVDGVVEGRPHTIVGRTAEQVMLLMREGQMDLPYERIG